VTWNDIAGEIQRAEEIKEPGIEAFIHMFLGLHRRLPIVQLDPLAACGLPRRKPCAAGNNIARKHNRLDRSIPAYLWEALRVVDLTTEIGQRKYVHGLFSLL
jgi:hypothetical protein